MDEGSLEKEQRVGRKQQEATKFLCQLNECDFVFHHVPLFVNPTCYSMDKLLLCLVSQKIEDETLTAIKGRTISILGRGSSLNKQGPER